MLYAARRSCLRNSREDATSPRPFSPPAARPDHMAAPAGVETRQRSMSAGEDAAFLCGSFEESQRQLSDVGRPAATIRAMSSGSAETAVTIHSRGEVGSGIRETGGRRARPIIIGESADAPFELAASARLRAPLQTRASAGGTRGRVPPPPLLSAAANAAAAAAAATWWGRPPSGAGGSSPLDASIPSLSSPSSLTAEGGAAHMPQLPPRWAGSAAARPTPPLPPLLRTPESRRALVRILASHYLFSALSPSALADVAECMEAVPVAAGELVVRAGEMLRNAFFVVERGAFDVIHPDAGFVGTLCAGSVFGERALIAPAPAEHSVWASPLSDGCGSGSRPSGCDATIGLHRRGDDRGVGSDIGCIHGAAGGAPVEARGSTALTAPRSDSDRSDPGDCARTLAAGFAGMTLSRVDGGRHGVGSRGGSGSAADGGGGGDASAAHHVLWRLERRTYRRVLASTAARQEEAAIAALRRTALLRSLSDAQLRRLAVAVREVTAPRGAVLIRKGDAGDALFFIAAGAAVCSDIGSGASASAHVHLGAGDCFGERALLLEEPRGAWCIYILIIYMRGACARTVTGTPFLAYHDAPRPFSHHNVRSLLSPSPPSSPPSPHACCCFSCVSRHCDCDERRGDTAAARPARPHQPPRAAAGAARR